MWFIKYIASLIIITIAVTILLKTWWEHEACQANEALLTTTTRESELNSIATALSLNPPSILQSGRSVSLSNRNVSTALIDRGVFASEDVADLYVVLHLRERKGGVTSGNVDGISFSGLTKRARIVYLLNVEGELKNPFLMKHLKTKDSPRFICVSSDEWYLRFQ